VSHLRAAAAVLLPLTVLVAACGSEVAQTPATRIADEFDCAARAPDFPEFEGQEIARVTVRDRTGLVVGCRRVRSDDSAAIRQALGPPMSGMDDTSLEISTADPAGTHILVLWVLQNCDEEAEVEFSQPFDYRLVVNQHRAGPCGPGTGLMAIELALAGPVNVGEIARSLHRQVTRP
jgi:hypothetical protein